MRFSALAQSRPTHRHTCLFPFNGLLVLARAHVTDTQKCPSPPTFPQCVCPLSLSHISYHGVLDRTKRVFFFCFFFAERLLAHANIATYRPSPSVFRTSAGQNFTVFVPSVCLMPWQQVYKAFAPCCHGTTALKAMESFCIIRPVPKWAR